MWTQVWPPLDTSAGHLVLVVYRHNFWRLVADLLHCVFLILSLNNVLDKMCCPEQWLQVLKINLLFLLL